MTQPAPTAPASAPPQASPPAAAKSSTSTLALIVLLVAMVLLGLHLVADRLTPYTSQARVSAYIVPIAPEVSGTVTAVHVVNNQRVRKGDPLYTLSDPSFVANVRKAEADLSATLREQEAQDAAIRVAQASLAAAQANYVRAASDTRRLERIYAEDRGAISVRLLEASQASSRQAAAQVESARAQLAQAIAVRGPRGPLNDRLVAARAAVERAELDVGRTRVVAPGDGLVTDLSIDRGQFAGAGAAVMTFISMSDVWIAADMTENNLGRVERGDPAEVLFDSLPGRVFPASVRSVGFGVAADLRASPGSLPMVRNSRDFLRPAQRFPVILAFDPGGLPPSALRHGAQVDVIIYSGESPFMNALGRFYIRMMSYLSYAY